ncbi:tetratricopeptide repeat protein [Tuanshanicoccus lijuaniae]|uniref:tetratricopeptide repeat protein n=1 Tax=Aerococcaceae bacterium zg-1292 TaxID=2774330 RepID=UPI001937B2F8|nr:tetratricopeptide repeat protein [Aerococcaceae bacterium zg-1292]QQA36346.1 tetratricopeptide repeat protein [Aerococcaceae bacterium zg-1292]
MLSDELFERFQSIVDPVALRQELAYYFELAYDDQHYYQELLALADRFGKSGYVDNKRLVLEELWTVRPNEAISYELTQLFVTMEDTELALQWLMQLKQFPASANNRLLEYHVANQVHNTQHAKKVLESIVREYPQTPQAYLLLGQLHLNQGNYKQAKTYFDVLLEYFSDAEWALPARNYLLELLTKNEVLSIEEIEKLIHHSMLPTISTAEEFYYVAKAYYLTQQYEKALEYVTVAWELNHDFIDANLLRLDIASRLSDSERVSSIVQWLAQALPIDHEALIEVTQTAYFHDALTDTLIKKAEQYVYLANLDEQFELISIITQYYVSLDEATYLLHLLDAWAEEITEPAYLSYGYAKVYQMQGDVEMACHYYMDALELALNIDTLVVEFVEFYLENNQEDKATQLIRDYQDTYYDHEQLKELRQKWGELNGES